MTHLLSGLAQQQVARASQTEMPGMVTDYTAAVLHGVRVRRESKESDKKKAENSFDLHCRSYRLPPFTRQFELLKSVQTPRKDLKPIPKVWRFDFCFPDFKLIVEIDGGIWIPGGGAHSHPIDIERNLLKRNDAALAGLTVIAFTPKQVMGGEQHAIAFTQHVLAARGWKR